MKNVASSVRNKIGVEETLKIQQRAVMIKRVIVIFFSTLIFSSCFFNDFECCDYVGTREISDGLYLEKYRTFCAGVFGEVIECYITDSLTFRQKVGSYDEHGHLRVELNGEIVEACRTERTYYGEENNYEFKKHDTIEFKTFPLSELRKGKLIEVCNQQKNAN